MSYLDDYIDAVKFSGELDPRLKVDPIHYLQLKEHFLDIKNNGLELNDFIKSELMPIADAFIQNTKFDVSDQCHSVSQSFFDRCTELNITKDCGMAVTVGNVKYKGKSVYPTTKEYIKNLIAEGFNPEQSLDLHVWLTLPNMAVLDLTIIPTLISKRLAKAKNFKNKDVVLWREGTMSKFRNLHYIPLLKDDEFMYKVDRVAAYI